MNPNPVNDALNNNPSPLDLTGQRARSALSGLAASSKPGGQPSKAQKAAQDFESILLTSLFDSLQKTFSWDSEDSTPGAADYRLMGTRALAEAVSASGGIGIARLVLSHLPVTKVPG